MPAGSSAIVAVVEHKWVDDVRAAMEQAAADVVTESVAAELAEQLEAGHDVAYTALATRDGVAVAGSVAGDEGVAGAAAVISSDEVAGVEYVATDEGVVVHAIDATAEAETVLRAELGGGVYDIYTVTTSVNGIPRVVHRRGPGE